MKSAERIVRLCEIIDRMVVFQEVFVEVYDRRTWDKKQSHAGYALAKALSRYARRELTYLL